MKIYRHPLTTALFLSLALTASATTRYVDVNSTNATPPFLNWITAATNIQNAVDVSAAGDEVVVTDGVYATGGRAVYGTMTNRVAVDKAVNLRSVNGPRFTEIRGYQLQGSITGDGAVRCAYLTNGATLSGFRLTKGATRRAGDVYRERSGGAVWCEPSAVVSNCMIMDNVANLWGGGVYSGTLRNCSVSGNSASYGGGVCNDRTQGLQVQLINCAVVGNSAVSRGGVFQGTVVNSIVYFNNAQSAENGPNYLVGSGETVFADSCTTPLPGGGGNIDNDPKLDDVFHLSAASPCRGIGNSAYARGTDLDLEAWATVPSMGCDEYSAGAVLEPLTISFVPAYTNVAVGFTVEFVAQLAGMTTSSVWEFGDGQLVTNGPYSGRLLASHAWNLPGDFAVVLWAYNASHPGGVSYTQVVHVVTPPVHYVAPNSLTPVSPFASWATAATNIQDAIDDASTIPGTWVLVTNGFYATGGRAVVGTMTNRVVVHRPVTVRSVNGPQFTIIEGSQLPGTTNGDGAVRCVYLTNGANLFGFTLTNGATRLVVNPYDSRESGGGGVYCASRSSVVSNCVLTGNSADNLGGGAVGGTLVNCTLTGNSAGYTGGGANDCILTHCTLIGNRTINYGGGGAFGSTLYLCTLTRNSAGYEGGGAALSTLNNCVVSSNTAAKQGGGAYYGALNNCYLIGNSADSGGGASGPVNLVNCTIVGNTAAKYGGGLENCTPTNCIIYYNTAPSGSNVWLTSGANHCCTSPLLGGVGNITNAPLFVDQSGGNLRLGTNSSCINAGNNLAVTNSTDLEGNPRIVGGTVDMGAYECQTPALLDYYTWLQGFGLPTAALSVYADSDGEGMNNWQEWRADTNPTNALSVLQMITVTNDTPGLQVTWQSVPTRTYWLDRATNLASLPSFSTIASNIVGQAVTTTYTDTTATSPGPFFYRVGVQP